MKIHLALAASALVALGIAGCANTRSSPKSTPSTSNTAAAPPPAPAPVPSGIPPVPAGALAPVTTASGLVYQDFVVGTGASPVTGQMVSVHYSGWLTNGTPFDSSRKRGVPYSFAVGTGRVVAGWDEGIMSMKVGGQRRLTVPPSLGYGPNGKGGVIPPNATMIFDVELMAVAP